MGRVSAKCEHCGEIELDGSKFRVLVDMSSGRGTYRFMCPQEIHPKIHPKTGYALGRLVIKSINPRQIELLLAAGVPLTRIDLELAPEVRPDDGAPAKILQDTQIDFGLLDDVEVFTQQAYTELGIPDNPHP